MANGLDDELTREVAERATGSALRLRDIDGVGDQTIRNLRASGFRNIQDVRNASVQELSRVSGVGRAKAEKIIRQAGGNTNQRASTGSTSAAGVKIPKGDFKVEIGDFDTAQARNEGRGLTRTPEAVAADKGNRAPITTDIDEWKANKGELDFPGVDTPTEDPEVLEKDRRFISPQDLTDDADGFF